LKADLLVIVAALSAASCGTPLMKLPSGPGVAVSRQEAAASLAQATAACSGLRTLTAEIAVSGSAGGHRLRGRLSAGVAAPASARLEAIAPFGPPLFIFVASGDDATLLLPRDDRVLVHGQPDAVLDAVAGVPLGAADLEATLTGCAAAADTADMAARQFGDTWRQLTTASAGELYLHRTAAEAPWTLAALVRRVPGGRAWRTEYRDHQNGLPRTIRVTSLDGGDDGARQGRAFDLQLVLSQVETNVPLEAAAFTVQIPKDAAPISLEELRRSGPLAPKSNDR
jgi:hypothetical protein